LSSWAGAALHLGAEIPFYWWTFVFRDILREEKIRMPHPFRKEKIYKGTSSLLDVVRIRKWLIVMDEHLKKKRIRTESQNYQLTVSTN
jgi:hypothetical protein